MPHMNIRDGFPTTVVSVCNTVRFSSLTVLFIVVGARILDDFQRKKTIKYMKITTVPMVTD